MDLEPRTESVQSQEALDARGKELEKAGRRILPCNLAEEGLFGLIAFFTPPDGTAVEEWNEEKADAIWVTWLKYGQKLVPEIIEVKSGNDLHKVFTDHASHDGFTGFSNPARRAAGFICHCKGQEHKSLVFQVTLTSMKELPPELMKLMDPYVQAVQS